MSVIWKTEFGPRRVREEPPTVVEALEAAACISPDREQQIELAATLLGVEVEDVRRVALRASRLGQRTLGISAPGRIGRAAVVVERKRPRRVAGA